MPLNTSSFLVSQGWEGVGVPLDGKAGKGLKKPLAIPQKRTLSGIGKDRDRANEWWNSIFTAGAKNLNIGPSKDSKPNSTSSSGTSTPAAPIATIDDAAAAESAEPTTKTLKTGWSMGPRSVMMSLSSLAKREHARKTLMSNFVRGENIASKEPSPEPVAQVKIARAPESVEASDMEVEAALPFEKRVKSRKTKEEKLEKKLAKERRKREAETDKATSSKTTNLEEKVKRRRTELGKKVSDDCSVDDLVTEKKKKKKAKKSPSPDQKDGIVPDAPRVDEGADKKQRPDSIDVPEKRKNSKKSRSKDGSKCTEKEDKKHQKDRTRQDIADVSGSKKRKRDRGEEKSEKKKRKDKAPKTIL